MSDLELITASIEVPKNTGIDGFLHTLESLLRLTRIQSISIDAKGKVTYTRYVDEEEPEPIKLDYTGVQPYHMLRNAPDGVEEFSPRGTNAAVVMAEVLDRVASERLHPTAIVASPDSVLWQWYTVTTGLTLSSQQSLCGLPLRFDRQVPDTALIVCAAFVRDGALVDTQKAYKIEMDYVVAPTTDVEVFV